MLLMGYLWLILGVPMHLVVHQPVVEEVCLESDNACHLKLVHADYENGCEHESHFKGEVKTCEICVLLQTDNAQTSASSQQLIPDFETLYQDLGLSASHTLDSYCLPEYRGPPLIS